MNIQLSNLFSEALAIRCRFSVARICDSTFNADSLELDVGPKFDAYLLGQVYWDQPIPKVFEGTSLAVLFEEAATSYRSFLDRVDDLPELELVA